MTTWETSKHLGWYKAILMSSSETHGMTKSHLNEQQWDSWDNTTKLAAIRHLVRPRAIPVKWQWNTYDNMEQSKWVAVVCFKWYRLTPVSEIGTHEMTEDHHNEQQWNTRDEAEPHLWVAMEKTCRHGATPVSPALYLEGHKASPDKGSGKHRMKQKHSYEWAVGYQG